MDVNLLAKALQDHAWIVVALCVTNGLVFIARLPAAKEQWERLPAVYRPLVPIALGLLSGIAEAVLAGQTWAYALITQVMAAVPAALYALPSPVTHRDPTFQPSEAPTKKD